MKCEEFIKQKTSRNPSMDVARFRYKVEKCASIIKVGDDEQPLSELVNWVGNLHAVDGDFLSHELSKIEVGYDTLVTGECPKCGREVRTRLGLSADFFRTQFDD